MRRKSILLGIHADPPAGLKWVYYLAPLIVVLVAYHMLSAAYLAENPHGKIMPSFTMMMERMWDLAFTLDPRTHTYMLWSDTLMSLTRLFTGLSAAAIVGLVVGMNIALFPGLQYLVLPGVIALSFVPMVALLPILLIALGIGEEAKIALIFLGLVFFIARDMYGATRALPEKLLVKARTLGASELQLVYRIVLPMIVPRLFESLRLNLGPAWLFLITGEAIASSQGLAYRIFLFRRVGPDMAGIIPYVLWITLLAFIVFYAMLRVQQSLCSWERR